MFKWLTRNDGRRRIERAKRRVASPRASVFTEFAIVMPVVAMICSAMIEIVGFWDAQVMANHAAWQVGRIVKCGYAPWANSYSLYGITRRYDYTLDSNKKLIKQDRTNIFKRFQTH